MANEVIFLKLYKLFQYNFKIATYNTIKNLLDKHLFVNKNKI